jgi:hypothetical protein
VQKADETNDELIRNLSSLQERHSRISEELNSKRQVFALFFSYHPLHVA